MGVEGVLLSADVNVVEVAAVLFCQPLHEGRFTGLLPNSELNCVNGRSATGTSANLSEFSSTNLRMPAVSEQKEHIRFKPES